MKQINKILLYLDSTEVAESALASAIFLSNLQNATIIALNVINQHVVTQLAKHSGKTLAEVEIELEENSWSYLYAAEDTAKNEGAHIVIMQEYGYPEEVLSRIATEYSVDLVILAHAGKKGTDQAHSRMISHFIEQIPCAVLVVK